MDNFNDIFTSFEYILDTDGEGDKNLPANISLTVGVVVDTDDPLQEGRLRIFCPSLNDNPKKLQHLPWAAYVSPFGGVVDNSCFTRGSNPDNATSNGPIHYGFFAVPEQGAHALVGCIDGDSRRRFWLGCFPSHQETHTLFHGRFKWNSGAGQPDGPLTSTNEKLQPTYDNMSDAFNNDRTSREWKTRGADYQAMAVSQTVGQLPNTNDTTYLDEQQAQIAAAEEDSWVKDILGAHGYDWTSFKNLGAFLASKVFGLSTPGQHAFSMDDRAFNCRIKLRTTSGHQILLDDTNERIYISTAQGNNWIELDQSGNIDIYAKRRVSVHAEEDINFSTEGSFRVKAKKGIFMYAGDTQGQTSLSNTPPDGQIRMHSSDDTHIFSDKNIREHVKQNLFIEVDNNINVMSNDWKQKTVGSYNLSSSGDVIVSSDSNITQIVSSNGIEITSSDVKIFGTTDVIISNAALSTSVIDLNTRFMSKQNGSGTGLTQPPQSVSGSPDTPGESDAEISIWTNRVPQHEPWPRVLLQDSNDPINAMNDGYQKNVQWEPQFDNVTSPTGLQPIGRVEGDATIPRGRFWRR